MNQLALISRKAEMSAKIVKTLHPELTDEEIVEKSKKYMQKSWVDIQLVYSALKKGQK